jgi:hypothetical protein
VHEADDLAVLLGRLAERAVVQQHLPLAAAGHKFWRETDVVEHAHELAGSRGGGSDHTWNGTLVATVVVAAALVVSLGVGVDQARRMTRVRSAALAAPDDLELSGQVRQGARAATVLRAVIGLLSLALIALAALLAT